MGIMGKVTIPLNATTTPPPNTLNAEIRPKSVYLREIALGVPSPLEE